MGPSGCLQRTDLLMLLQPRRLVKFHRPGSGRRETSPTQCCRQPRPPTKITCIPKCPGIPCRRMSDSSHGQKDSLFRPRDMPRIMVQTHIEPPTALLSIHSSSRVVLPILRMGQMTSRNLIPALTTHLLPPALCYHHHVSPISTNIHSNTSLITTV